jgi:hypothetical protein
VYAGDAARLAKTAFWQSDALLPVAWNMPMGITVDIHGIEEMSAF